MTSLFFAPIASDHDTCPVCDSAVAELKNGCRDVFVRYGKIDRMEPSSVLTQAPHSDSVDLQRMLLLGLLSKKLPLPYAVVKPRQQKEIKPAEENVADKSDENEEEECQSPPVQVCGTKRSRSEVDYDTERKEKR